jgi:hypothetical protein
MSAAVYAETLQRLEDTRRSLTSNAEVTLARMMLDMVRYLHYHLLYNVCRELLYFRVKQCLAEC